MKRNRPNSSSSEAFLAKLLLVSSAALDGIARELDSSRLLGYGAGY